MTLFNLPKKPSPGKDADKSPTKDLKPKPHTDSYIRSKSSFKKLKRPQSPRNPYKGRAYIPPLMVPCSSLKDAQLKLKNMGFTPGNTTANFWQDRDGRTAVVQEPFDSTESYQLYIRGNQPDQI